MSIITALRAPGRRSARRSSVSTRRAVDSRINRAAKAVVERLEGRTLLDGLPYGVSVSPDAVYSFTGDATNGYALTLSAGAESIDANLGAGGVPFSLTLTGTANVSINSPEIFTALTLSGTAKATVSSSGGGATGNLLDITGTSGFSMPLTGTAPTATLDLMDNDMILRGAGSGELPVLQALLKSGKTGPGLKSSDAAASPSSEKTALGYSCGLASLDGLTTINGQAVSAMDCFVKYTLSGDANLSGKVDNADLTALSNHWGQTSGAYWQQGDFSLDGKVTNVDYALLQNNYQNSINGPNFNRTLLPVGLPITTVEGQPFSGALATFTDTQNPAGGQANVGNYTASVSWGNNSFVPATVTADTNPSDPNGYVISATSANLLSNPDTLIVTMVQYAASSGLQGRPASLGEPVVSVTPAVSDLGAVAISTSEIDLSWTVNATNATAIEVDSSIDGVTYTATMLDPTATSYRDTGLTEGSHHYYEVRAIQSVPSAFAGPLDLFAIPMVPGLTANTVSSSTIDLTWGAATSPGATGVQVWRSSDGVTYSLLTTLAPDATNYTDTGVPEATPYLYQVRVAEGSASSASDTVYAITIPAAPTGLTATADGGAVDLSWADNSQNESAYNIYRSTDDSTFTLIDTVPPNTTAYIDTGAPDGSTDYYQVSAADDGGESGASSVASATPVPPLQLADDPAILVGYGSPRADYTVLHGHTLSILDATDGVLANDTDPNGWTLSVASYTQPSHGVLTLNSDGTFTYAAAADFTGQDTFTYTATDDIGATGNTAAVTINVTDQMPEAASDVVTLSRALGPGGTPLDYAAPFSSTLTASDADGDPLTYSLVSGPTSDQGTFVFSTTTGAYTFTPNPANMQMGTLNVVFKVTDGALTSNLGDVIFAGYTITDNSTRNAMDSVPLPIAGGANQSWSTVENSALEYGPPGLLFGAADNDTVTPDPDVPVIDSGLIESPQHGQVSISTSDGSFYYQPNAGFVGRDWFTYRLLDGSKPSDYATIFIDVLPLNISLSVGDLQPGDPAAKIPTLTDGLPTGPFVQLHLNNVNSLPQGSTVTLSMNSDVVPDLNVSSLQPGSDGNVQFIGHDAGTNTHTWTVGVNSPPTYVWASGLTGTDYDQVLFHLTAQVAPTITGSPTVAAPPASQPIVAAQNATVLGKGGYLAAFDGTWDYPEQDKDAPKDKDGNPIGFIRGGPWNGSTVIYEFAKYHYASPNVDYHRGVGNALDHKVVGHLFLGAFGAAEANAFVNAAYDSLATFYTDPNNRGIPVDIIGYSRGAYEAAWLAHRIQEDGIPDLNTKKTVLVWVTAEHGQRKQVPKVTYQYVHPQIRWVGLVSPVNQMGPLTNWPSTLPPGVVNCFEALDNDPNNIIYLQIPITCATGTNLDQPAPYPEGHPQIGIDPKVLNDMISDAKKAGVPVK